MEKNADIIQYKNDKCIIKANSDNINIIKESILDNIKFDNFSNFINEINRNGTYRFVNSPEGGYLYQYSDGSVSGIWRNAENRKILEHGRLKNVEINIGNICKLAANQAMFAYIVVQLNELNGKMDIIIKGMHDDRISKIDGAIKAFEYIEDRNNDNLINIALQIETAISELERELLQLFNKTNPNAKIGDNWFKSKNNENEKIHNQIHDAILWIFRGYETLFKIGQRLGKNTAANHMITFLKTCKWKELAEFARGLEYKKTQRGFPEEQWEKIDEDKYLLVKNLQNMIDIDKKEINEYVIEFKGDYLLEVLK